MKSKIYFFLHLKLFCKLQVRLQIIFLIMAIVFLVSHIYLIGIQRTNLFIYFCLQITSCWIDVICKFSFIGLNCFSCNVYVAFHVSKSCFNLFLYFSNGIYNNNFSLQKFSTSLYLLYLTNHITFGFLLFDMCVPSFL